MKIKILGQKSNAVFDPLRFFKNIHTEDNPGVIASKALLGTVTGIAEVPFSLLENLFYRMPMELINPQNLKQDDCLGEFDLPGIFETEDLFAKLSNLDLKKEQTTILRQSFIDQYSDKYSLHRLDFNFTPLLSPKYNDWRIMDLNIRFTVAPAIQTTDIFPQTKWEKEGLKVGDRVYLNAKGHYQGKAKLKAGLRIPTTEANVTPLEGNIDVIQGRDYFYSVEYETQIPTIEGYALSDGFGWRLQGTYQQYIDCGTKRFAAIFLVPKHIKTGTIFCDVICGITNRDRRDATYPSTRNLKYGVARSKQISFNFA